MIRQDITQASGQRLLKSLFRGDRHPIKCHGTNMKILVWLQHSTSHFSAQERHLERLQNAFPNHDVVCCTSSEQVESHLPETEIAIVWRFFQNQVIAAPNLRILATPAAGRDYFQVDLPAQVTKIHGSFHGKLMAETALAYMLAANRGVVASSRLQEKDPWPRDVVGEPMRLFQGSHVGILGFGKIGQAIGKMAKLNGAAITGIRKKSAPKIDWMTSKDQIITLSDLDKSLPLFDHLVICLPRDPGTDHIINSQRLSLMKNEAWIHNLGRGNAIDEKALVHSLHTGLLAGACLDVFEKEPLQESSPLRTLPNCLIMPHTSAMAPEYLDFFLDEFIPQAQDLMHSEENP